MKIGFEVFLVVARELSITKAANELHITQQCASDHIKRLEKEYNVVLFERRPKFRLTQAGEIMLHNLLNIQIMETSMSRSLAGIAEGTVGGFTLGISTSRAPIILPRVLPRYYQCYPKVNISFTEEDTQILEERLLNGQVDLFIGVNTSPHPDYKIQTLTTDEIILVISAKLLRREFTEQEIRQMEDGIDLKRFSNIPFTQSFKTGKVNHAIQEYLDSYGFNYIDATKVIDDYNFEDRKLVEIVKSTYFNPKVLVVDETTTALGQKGREELFKVMHKVRDTGNCVIFISHDLEEVIEQSDNISVLRDGVKIGSITKEEATPDRLKALMVGREIGDSYYRTDYGEKVSDEVVLSAKNVTVKGQIENLNLDLHKGEILGIGGLSECGMHEVGKALFGASYFRQGSVTLGDGTPINSIPDAIKHSIAYASKDRDNESLVINDTIGDNICLPSLEDLKTHGFLRAKTMNEFANKFAKQMSTKMTGVDQFVSALSGGNKQKVVLARWVGKDSDLIILDSPTRGIDVKVKADIYAMMDDMRKRGKSIIMISEEIMELLGMADRILIMKDGKINGEFLRSPDLKDTDLIDNMI